MKPINSQCCWKVYRKSFSVNSLYCAATFCESLPLHHFVEISLIREILNGKAGKRQSLQGLCLFDSSQGKENSTWKSTNPKKRTLKLLSRLIFGESEDQRMGILCLSARTKTFEDFAFFLELQWLFDLLFHLLQRLFYLGCAI